MRLRVGAHHRIIDTFAERHAVDGSGATSFGINPSEHRGAIEDGAGLPGRLPARSRPCRECIQRLERCMHVAEPPADSAELIEQHRVHRVSIGGRQTVCERDGVRQ